jgi:hypothetical protein
VIRRAAASTRSATVALVSHVQVPPAS